ncbi:hypothetical protein P7K49_012237 [Saguinus oedipus]|uniref:Uncharacterized protein n=1 Tax=Saguinus oedipus TaxID=9490 RepID=A0ABQ9VSY4_SAGOE|nr:hypothetical protein P7K49_012237 [Saguinus oedipus]
MRHSLRTVILVRSFVPGGGIASSQGTEEQHLQIPTVSLVLQHLEFHWVHFCGLSRSEGSLVCLDLRLLVASYGTSLSRVMRTFYSPQMRSQDMHVTPSGDGAELMWVHAGAGGDSAELISVHGGAGEDSAELMPVLLPSWRRVAVVEFVTLSDWLGCPVHHAKGQEKPGPSAAALAEANVCWSQPEFSILLLAPGVLETTRCHVTMSVMAKITGLCFRPRPRAVSAGQGQDHEKHTRALEWEDLSPAACTLSRGAWGQAILLGTITTVLGGLRLLYAMGLGASLRHLCPKE